jgi:hypothetical protein
MNPRNAILNKKTSPRRTHSVGSIWIKLKNRTLFRGMGVCGKTKASS